MKVAIDGGCLANRRGFGRFTRELLGALAEIDADHEYVLVLDRPSADSVEVPERFRVVVVDVARAPSQAASARGQRSALDLWRMGRVVARETPDLIFFPATYSYFPVWNCRKTIVTLHDTLALERPELVFPTKAGRWAWTLKERAAVLQASPASINFGSVPVGTTSAATTFTITNNGTADASAVTVTTGGKVTGTTGDGVSTLSADGWNSVNVGAGGVGSLIDDLEELHIFFRRDVPISPLEG